jgi:Fe-S cluster biogenesis protein NfuA
LFFIDYNDILKQEVEKMAVSEETKKKVEAVIETIRPRLQMDGGDVSLVEITDDHVVRVELQGACKGCPMSQVTLHMGIEKTMIDQIPEITRVEDINSKIPQEFLDKFRQARNK